MRGDKDKTWDGVERRSHERMFKEEISHIHGCIESLKTSVEGIKTELKRNTDTTEQIHDLLVSFRVLGRIAKWVTTVGGAGGVLWGAYEIVSTAIKALK